ncbi:MAG: o-succinylbenzoate---CoA ligase [Actinomycetota bacterium]|nr:o-succinylbenzoate---CoA ligase [Actinomycetota bacterium]
MPLLAESTPAFVDALRRAWDGGDAVLPVDPRLPAPAADALVRAMRVDEPVDEGDALVVVTSGTTGEPKGAVLTHDAVRASARATSARLQVDAGDRWLSVLPLAHIGGLSVVTRALASDTPLTFDVEDPAASLVSMVATQVRRADLSRFRVVVVGGAAPPSDLPANAVTTYGLTETGSGIVYDGTPLDGVDVRDVDGELQVRGPMLLRAYRDGTDPRTSAGRLPTGDAGAIVDGRVVVHGRIAEVVVTGGEKVWPDPVESILRTVPGVGDVAIAGVDDDEWGQRVVAFVVAEGDAPTLDALRDAVKVLLPAYAAPKQLVLVDALPRTAIGKVQRRLLVADL